MDANVAIGIGLAVGTAAGGVGIGQGIAVNGALNGMARQPELRKFLSTQMLIGLAFPELCFLLSWLIGLILLAKVSVPSAAPAGAPGAASMLQHGQTYQMTHPSSRLVSLRDGSVHRIVLS